MLRVGGELGVEGLVGQVQALRGARDRRERAEARVLALPPVAALVVVRHEELRRALAAGHGHVLARIPQGVGDGLRGGEFEAQAAQQRRADLHDECGLGLAVQEAHQRQARQAGVARVEEAARARAVAPPEAAGVLLVEHRPRARRARVTPARVARAREELACREQRAVVVEEVVLVVVEELGVACLEQLEAADRRGEVLLAREFAIAMRACSARERRDRHAAALAEAGLVVGRLDAFLRRVRADLALVFVLAPLVEHRGVEEPFG